MENEIIPRSDMSLAPSYDEKIFDTIVSTTDYLKRLQLAGANSDLAKEGKVGMGHFALIRDSKNVKDLGSELDALVCAWRYKAMEIKNDTVLNVYDPLSPDFTRIKDLSDVKDSGCMVGLDFLLYLPKEDEFVTLYLSSKSARREAPALRAKIDEVNKKPGPVTLKVALASNKKYKWHVITVNDCVTTFDLPDEDEFAKVVNKFQNPPAPQSEPIKTDTGDRVR
jgi:hypothetical protein